MVNGPAVACSICQLAPGAARCGLGRVAGAQLDGPKAVRHYRRGQPIFLAGTVPVALFVVRTGRVKLVRLESDGQEHIVRLLGPGAMFGHRSLLAGELTAVGAVAVEDAVICSVPVAAVDELLRDVPALARYLLTQLARDLRWAEDLMASLLRKSATERAAQMLLALLEADRGAAEPGRFPNRDLQRTELARMIGVAPETLSRALRELADAGAITLSRRDLRIVDPERLRRLAEGPTDRELDEDQDAI
jgi:CRP/FNR family transcriptional regulator, polysaccharide utilization system transcription regulator